MIAVSIKYKYSINACYLLSVFRFCAAINGSGPSRMRSALVASYVFPGIHLQGAKGPEGSSHLWRSPGKRWDMDYVMQPAVWDVPNGTSWHIPSRILSSSFACSSFLRSCHMSWRASVALFMSWALALAGPARRNLRKASQCRASFEPNRHD